MDFTWLRCTGLRETQAGITKGLLYELVMGGDRRTFWGSRPGSKCGGEERVVGKKNHPGKIVLKGRLRTLGRGRRGDMGRAAPALNGTINRTGIRPSIP